MQEGGKNSAQAGLGEEHHGHPGGDWNSGKGFLAGE